MCYFYNLYTVLALDLLDYSKINRKPLHAMWAVAVCFLQRCCNGFKKCWLQIADVICGCGCKVCIHRWCGQLIILLISYWEQSASLGHTSFGSLRGAARAKTFTIPQKPGSELGERKMLIDNLRSWPWGFIVSWDISCSNQVFESWSPRKKCESLSCSLCGRTCTVSVWRFFQICHGNGLNNETFFVKTHSVSSFLISWSAINQPFAIKRLSSFHPHTNNIS